MKMAISWAIGRVTIFIKFSTNSLCLKVGGRVAEEETSIVKSEIRMSPAPLADAPIGHEPSGRMRGSGPGKFETRLAFGVAEADNI
jgi:hypothetical protein